jgi:hypothetical protein
MITFRELLLAMLLPTAFSVAGIIAKPKGAQAICAAGRGD